MITQYIRVAMGYATYEILQDDGTYYGEIPPCVGVWANAGDLETCREELQEALEAWILIRMQKGLPLPVLDEIDLNVKEAA